MLKFTALRYSELKCQSRYLSGQIAALIKVLILKATSRESEPPIAGGHAGTAATEVEEASTLAANGTAPLAAGGTDIDERTSAETTEARHGQFKRRGKSSCCIVSSPT